MQGASRASLAQLRDVLTERTDGVRAAEICDAIVRSAREGRRVDTRETTT